jgi:peptidoglycan/LPS O-acetylase OafA/YrhL
MFLLPTINRASIPFLGYLEDLGRRSYGIYLAHFVVINAAVFGASKSNVRFESIPIVVFPFLFVTALGTSLIMMEAMARIVPARKFYRYLFGIVPPAVPGAGFQRRLRTT